MAFVADDLTAWLVGLLADAGRRKLTLLILGSDQERALRRAAEAAVEATAMELAPAASGQADQLAMVVGEVFREPTPQVALARQTTLLEALQAGIAERLAVLDDPDVTGTGRSSAELLGVRGGRLAETLAGHLVREIMVRGSTGGPLAPLAGQLNHDVTHLQGQRLEGIVARLADQVMTLAKADSALVIPGKPVRLLPRPTFLAGREDLLTELDIRLTSGDVLPPRIVVLCGLGGSGKTSIAVAYAHMHLAEVGLAWQFAAEDPTVLAAEFSELAAQLGVRDAVGTPEPVASVHNVLAASSAGWLLVFDNAPDPASVERFLPPAGPGRILVTSQNPNWPHGQPLPVPFLKTEVAADFLITRTSDPDQQAARELANELDGLPLALEQAAAYILATGGTLARYLDLFKERRADMLRRGEPTGYTGTVATTWGLAFARLEQSAPSAVGLLRLLAFCAPEAAPLTSLLKAPYGLIDRLHREVAGVLKPLLEDPLAATDAIAALRQYSLITPAGGGMVLVHRLVQAVTTDQMPVRLAQAWQQAAAELIEATIPDDPSEPISWPLFAALLPHAQTALAADSGSMDSIGSYLAYSGGYATARAFTQSSLDARAQVLGPEHPATLIARANLASFTGEAGDAARARDQYAALLPVWERILGPEDPETPIHRSNLANWTGLAGDATGARDQLAALLPIRERILGPEHPDTLTTRGSLAYWTGVAGDAARARDELAALLPIEERILGSEHLSTLKQRGNHARFTGQAGDAAGARDQYTALLPIEERVLGPEHPETLTTRANLASFAGEAGDAAGARDEFAGLLPIEERVLGPEHPDTLTTRSNLARWTGQAGDGGGARDRYAALLPIREQVLGPEHPDTLATRSNLARWTGQAGDGGGARDQYAALLPIREQVLGPEHPDTLATRSNLAGWTGQAGDAGGARDQYAALLPIREQVLGPEHPDTLTTRSNLAGWTGQAGDAGGARDQYAALLSIEERVLGPEHPETLATRANLASFAGEAGDAAGARDEFAGLLLIKERVLGPEHRETLTTRGNLAYWTGQAGDAGGARDRYTALVPIEERVLGPEHPETLTTRANLASFAGEAGDSGGARDQYAALLPIFERVLGPEHPDTLGTRGNLAYWTRQVDGGSGSGGN